MSRRQVHEYIHSQPERRRAWLLSEYLYDWMSPAAMEMVAQTGTVISQGAAAVRALDGATEVLWAKAAPGECMEVKGAGESVDGEAALVDSEAASVDGEVETEMVGPVVDDQAESVDGDVMVGSEVCENDRVSLPGDVFESVTFGETVRRRLGAFVSRAVEPVPGIAALATRAGLSLLADGRDEYEQRAATNEAVRLNRDDASRDTRVFQRAAPRTVRLVRQRGRPRAAWHVLARWWRRVDGEGEPSG